MKPSHLSDFKARGYATYKRHLAERAARPQVSRAKELAEAQALIERVEARRKAMLRKPE